MKKRIKRTKKAKQEATQLAEEPWWMMVTTAIMTMFCLRIWIVKKRGWIKN